MKILILGIKGSMGRRYRAILDYLKVDYDGIDLHNEATMQERLRTSTHVIIATPTDTHYSYICKLAGQMYSGPVLCEKPITKNLEELKHIYDQRIDVTMMNQYIHMIAPSDTQSGVSGYNFFHHGNDGLVWDCIQIIGLAKGRLYLREEFPTWLCQINGEFLSKDTVDKAYVTFVKGWLYGERQNHGRIYQMHEKAIMLQGQVKYDGRYQRLDWSPSEDGQHTTP